MNAEQDNVSVLQPVRAGVPFHSDPDCDLAGALSALTDGEIGADELDALLADADHRSELHADWHAYQVIGDVLRGTAPAVSNVAPQALWPVSVRDSCSQSGPKACQQARS
ncbi:hypothetical protein Y695_01501 [Hydrogenophaga sp. T4]|nr:hypothetical protein Y695_01501 [Hydrogenophaga sp. T4]